MDTGLFGGTFNPLHNGHLGIIQHVKEEFRLGQIILFPSASPPHKPAGNLAPARDRLEMIRASVRDMEGFEASDIELKRKGPSFTIDTIQAFRQTSGDRFFLLMGSDAFFDINTWKNKDRIFRTIPIIVMVRQSSVSSPSFTSFIDENISKGYRKEKNKFIHDKMQDIIICNVPKIDISSTLIRDRIRKNLSVQGLVPAPVKEIIMKRNLYI
ncbi:nicotinate-nucleotide adenylyltransferase [Desulfospira joergensenii]|uniref:nicotinate-nucleotide adenylyltransferase n=1 Tax=Desulfospira joergensenii TaxID=53329 RepID=UPI0003B748BB|nr:nicotinate-nucleotide adenylyltransferase [Desulfospira joergensenii]